MKTLCLVFGGNSLEHEISILTLKDVYYGFDQTKYRLYLLYLAKDNKFYYVKNFLKVKNVNNLNKLKKRKVSIGKDSKPFFKDIHKHHFDYLFDLTHGKGMEDYTLKGYFEFLDIPLISNNGYGASLGMDKSLCKEVINNNKIIKCVKGDVYEIKFLNYKKLTSSLTNYPYIIKACYLGSSIGVYKVNNKYEVYEAIENISKYDNYFLVEKCLKNFLEISIALYLKDEEFVFSSLEIIDNNDVFSYDDKYLNNVKKVYVNEHQLLERLKKVSKKIYNLFKLDYLVRIDYFYDKEEEELYFNEINILPGSLSYKLFENKGILLPDLIDDLIKVGEDNYKLKAQKINVLGDNKIQSLVNFKNK